MSAAPVKVSKSTESSSCAPIRVNFETRVWHVMTFSTMPSDCSRWIRLLPAVKVMKNTFVNDRFIFRCRHEKANMT